MVDTKNNILVMSCVFPPYKSWWWQAQVAYDYAIWLLWLWYKVTVLTHKFEWLASKEIIDWLTVIRFSSFSDKLLSYGLYNPKWLYTWLKKHIDWYHAVFLHDIYSISSYLAYFFCKRNSVPYLLMPHWMGNLSQQKVKYLFKKVFCFLFSNKVSQFASKLIFCSENEYKNYELPYNDYSIITNWINQTNWTQSLHSLNKDQLTTFLDKYWLKKSDKIIFSIWRLVKAKRFDLLISYIEDFLKNDLWYKLFIAWPDWWEESNIKELISSKWLEKSIILVSWIFGIEKYCLYTLGSLFVLSSDLEWFPIVVCEAVSSQLPCLLSQWCNISPIENKIEVFTNKIDFISKLELLLNNKNTPYRSIDIARFNILDSIKKLDRIFRNI